MVLPGFNTDFKYRGETYHAQTEDNGVNNPVVVTLLYFKGAILASRRTSYRDLLGNDSWQRELMDIMKAQHKEIMRDLLAGRLDADTRPPRTAARVPAGAAPPGPAVAAAAAPPAAPAAVALAEPPPAQPRAARPLPLDEAILAYLRDHAAARGTPPSH